MGRGGYRRRSRATSTGPGENLRVAVNTGEKIVTESNVNPGESGNSTSLGLLERVKAKDQSAWQQMVSLYAPLVDHWTCKAGLQDADALDVRQEVFLAV